MRLAYKSCFGSVGVKQLPGIKQNPEKQRQATEIGLKKKSNGELNGKGKIDCGIGIGG